MTVDLRVVIASVDTYLRFAEAVNRLDLAATGDSKSLTEMMGGGSNGSEGDEREDGIRMQTAPADGTVGWASVLSPEKLRCERRQSRLPART